MGSHLSRKDQFTVTVGELRRTSTRDVELVGPRVAFRQKLHVADQGDSFLVLDLRLSVASEDSTSRVITLRVRVLTKICTSQRRKTDGRVGRNSINENRGRLTEMKGGALLNVVAGEGTIALESLAGENQVLLVGRDALLVLNLRLDIVNGFRRLGFEGNSLTCQV